MAMFRRQLRERPSSLPLGSADTETSAARRTTAAVMDHAPGMVHGTVVSTKPAPQLELPLDLPALDLSSTLEPTSGDEDADSDVFVCHVAAPVVPAVPVTLFVYGWHNVQPGLLSWSFKSMRSALDAVRTMRNATHWSIVSGEWTSIDAARSNGAVLIEQLG